MTGKQVLGYEVDKIQIIHFVLPKITVETKEAYYEEDADGCGIHAYSDEQRSRSEEYEVAKTTACVKVWEKILINRSNFTEELLEKYIENYELCTDDGGNIIEMYRALDDKDEFVQGDKILQQKTHENAKRSDEFVQGDKILQQKTHENAKRSDEFVAKLVNQLRFTHGIAGLSHRF